MPPWWPDMSPPGLTAIPGIGVSTSPSCEQLKSLARLVLSNIGANFGANRVNRLVTRFVRAMPNAGAWTFLLYLTNAVQMSAEQRRAVLRDPEIARVISYADPTGETAVNNVLRTQRGRQAPRR